MTPTPKSYLCILAHEADPGIGLRYNSSTMKLLAYEGKCDIMDLLLVSPTGTYVFQREFAGGTVEAQIVSRGMASQFYGQSTQVVPPMESGLFTELRDI